MLANVIVAAIILLIVGFSAYQVFKKHDTGGCCGKDCSSCGGNCHHIKLDKEKILGH